MIHEKDNITKERTEDGRLVFEPGYCGYLRSQGFQIEAISEIDTVTSRSNPEKKYLVAKVKTYDYPKDHPDLDLVEHTCTITVCTCWNWRTEHSANLDSQKPSKSGSCKHCREKWKVEKAKADENQQQLGQ